MATKKMGTTTTRRARTEKRTVAPVEPSTSTTEEHVPAEAQAAPPPLSPTQQMEADIVNAVNRHVVAGVHPSEIAKTLAAIQIDLVSVLCNGMGQMIEARVTQTILNNLPKNKAKRVSAARRKKKR